MGTLNHFARDVGVPLNLQAAVRKLFTGQVTKVDVGGANGRVFVNELYSGAINERQNFAAEIVFIDLVDLGGDLQRNTGCAGNPDRAVRALFRRNPAQEGEVASLPKRRPSGVAVWSAASSADSLLGFSE